MIQTQYNFISTIITDDEYWYFAYDLKQNGKVAKSWRKFAQTTEIAASKIKKNINCFFFIRKKLCTKSLFLKEVQLMQHPIKVFWTASVKELHMLGRTCGNINLFSCCSTIHLPILRRSTLISWQEIWLVLNNSPYLPDWSPRGHFLFSKLMMELKGHRFALIEEI